MNSTVMILDERSTDQNLRMLETVLSSFPYNYLLFFSELLVTDFEFFTVSVLVSICLVTSFCRS